MLILGDPKWRNSTGKTTELQFFKGEQLVVVVHGNLIRNFNVRLGEIGTMVTTVNLRSVGEAGFGSLPNDARIAFWIDTPETGRHRLGMGQIDYWKHDFDGDVQTVEVHARGALAPLIDQRCNELFEGSLEQFIEKVGSQVPVRCDGLENRRIRAYVNAPSIFGALRLMGISLGFVVSEDPDGSGAVCRSNARAIEELQTGPLHEIGPDKILSGTVERGAPVRKRGVT